MITTLVTGQLGTNCYIYAEGNSGAAVVIDPGDDAGYITDRLAGSGLIPEKIILTHGHFDHLLAALELQVQYGIPVFIHPSDRFLLDRAADTASHFLGYRVREKPPPVTFDLVDGQILKAGAGTLLVIHTPGHTPGSVSLYLEPESACICGDLIFAGGSVGRTDHAYSSADALRRSIGRILVLPGETVLFPGHGEKTTVHDEKPFHKV